MWQYVFVTSDKKQNEKTIHLNIEKQRRRVSWNVIFQNKVGRTIWSLFVHGQHSWCISHGTLEEIKRHRHRYCQQKPKGRHYYYNKSDSIITIIIVIVIVAAVHLCLSHTLFILSPKLELDQSRHATHNEPGSAWVCSLLLLPIAWLMVGSVGSL